MPQLNTSTWLITIFSALVSLFVLMQLKLAKHNFTASPTPKTSNMTKYPAPWKTKWTKIYSPLSPLQR
uniref:ATP synthase complex subunit 8 n=1 Tax=Parocnus serus TaxID=2546659 RepID=A0A4Y5T123_PARSU|nr:ATP synthase F0 subunit 8 [Parocnus serus]QDA81228.1 ATP synthase F0 subunit 8 [Parocnus serus]